MIEFTYKVPVPRDLLDEGNVVLQWKKEKKRRAELEMYREQARQDIRDHPYMNKTDQAWAQTMVDSCNDLTELGAVCGSYGLKKRWEKETKPMAMSKEDELNLLKEQQKSLAKRIEKLEYGKWGKEPSNGAMFKIEKKFSSLGTAPKYSYAALKANGVWYLTGTGNDGTKSYSWEALKKFAGQYSRVWRLTVAEELLD